MRARIADIIYHASQLSGVSVETLLSRKRTGQVARVRQAICLIAREQLREGEPAYSYPLIGQVLGRDHSSIIHNCWKAADMVTRDPVFAEFVAAVRDAAATGELFAGSVSIASPPPPPTKPVQKVTIAQKPAPVIVPKPAPHIKKITLEPGELPDQAHKFHAGIAAGSAALLKALAA